MFTKEQVNQLKDFLREDGINFFKELKEKRDEINCVYMEGRIPHPVHFREGMQIRNFMRSIGFKDETDFDIIENHWVDFVEEAIK